MTLQTRALICYDDSGVADNRDFQLANQLIQDLPRRNQNVRPNLSKYTHAPPLDDTYQWLIVIYPSHGVQQQHVVQAINTAMKRSVERKMRGVFLLTTSNPSTIPPEWASIRTYDASSQREANKAIEGLLQAMDCVKVPYKEIERPSGPPLPSIIPPPPIPHKLFSSRNVVLAVLTLLLVIFGIVLWPKASASPNPSDITPKQTTSTPDTNPGASQSTPTLTAAQILYNEKTEPTPTVQGFQNNSQNWEIDQDGTCQLDHDRYHARHDSFDGKYTTCMAQGNKYKNFAYEVTLTITDNSEGGIIFRADNSTPDIYNIFSIKSDPNGNAEFSTYYCRKVDCQDHVLSKRQQLDHNNVASPGLPITLTVIAQESKVNLYVQKQPVDELSDVRSISGNIGCYTALLNNNSSKADVTFSNLKIWSLDK